MDEELEEEHVEEEEEQLTSEQLLAKCKEELLEQKAVDIEKGVRFTDEQFAQLKYETNDVKTLKNLTVRIVIIPLLFKIYSIKIWIYIILRKISFIINLLP